jgi:hypothetical protein
MSNLTIEQRFWKYVNKSDGCWEWTGQKTTSMGYGRIRDTGNKYIRSHRLSYELHIGPIPDDMLVLHACDNPSCVNPSHLFLGTHQENTNDRVKKGRSAHGEGNGSARLTRSQVLDIRKRAGEWGSQKALAKEYGVSSSRINEIVNRVTWTHI